jgi:hypothetical protein
MTQKADKKPQQRWWLQAKFQTPQAGVEYTELGESEGIVADEEDTQPGTKVELQSRLRRRRSSCATGVSLRVAS